MPASLLLLIRLRACSSLRQFFSRDRPPLAIALSFASLLFLLGVLCAPALVPRIPGVDLHRVDISVVQTGISVLLLLIWVPNLLGVADDKVLRFSLSEIDFLFAGPFSRRELLVYRLLSDLFARALYALLISAWIFLFTDKWPLVFFGVLLALLFVYLLSTAIALVRLTIVDRVYDRARKIVLRVGLLLLGLALLKALFGQGNGSSLQRFHLFRDSFAGKCLLAPFEPFSRMITAPSWYPDAVIWGGLALLQILLLLVVVMQLQANYLEAVLASSQKAYERMQGRHRGEKIMALAGAEKLRWCPPDFRFGHGEGPLAWRQLIAALRNTRVERWGLWVLVIAVCSITSGGLLRLKADEPFMAALPSLASRLSLFLVGIGGISIFTYDFRKDIDRLDLLKIMPFKPIAIVAGQLLTPLLFTTAGTLVFLFALFVFNPAFGRHIIEIAAMALPLNLLVLGYENAVCLLFPPRTQSAEEGVQNQMRELAITVAKFFIFVLLVALILGVGSVTYFMSNQSLIIFKLTVWGLMTATAISMVFLNVWAFNRFDASRDTPLS